MIHDFRKPPHTFHPKYPKSRLGEQMECDRCGLIVDANDEALWKEALTDTCGATVGGIGATPADQQLGYIYRHAEQISIALRLKILLRDKRSIRVKFGMDPTAPDLTLGHYVPLRLLRAFQDWGHKAVLIVGDATARVGDPTGRDSTRPILNEADVKRNVETYVEQVSKVLLTNSANLEICYNSEWLGKLNIYDIIKLAGQKTVKQMLQRESFKERFVEPDGDIRLHELMYPLLQAYDSVKVQADVELGGSDQLFNMMMGRDIQEINGQQPQVVITTPLLIGLDGSEKMSKSKGNFIPICGDPSDMFGKIMSIPDSLMEHYFRLLTNVYDEPLLADAAVSLIERRPMLAKMQLARIVTECLHGEDAGCQAEKSFNDVVRDGKTPLEMPVETVAKGSYKATELLVLTKMTPSKTVAAAKIKEGAVRLNGEKIDDPLGIIDVNGPLVLQLGKRRYVSVVLSKDDAGT